MEKFLCLLLGHKIISHLDLIYGCLPREHKMCERCGKTISFEKCTDERAKELPLVDCFKKEV